MSKVINISDDKTIVYIGTDDGDIKEVRLSDLNFIPVVGDEVEIFENETRTIVSKKEKKNDQNISGININVSNTQNVSDGASRAGKSVVNKLVYCLLCLFLGGIGAHKFYAHKIGAGVCYLIFCWTCVPSFIALIEFIVALCQKEDVNGNILA